MYESAVYIFTISIINRKHFVFVQQRDSSRFLLKKKEKKNTCAGQSKVQV